MMIVAIAVGVWLFAVLWGVSLCWAAARGDEVCESHWRNGPS
jgi:hypothetical protein